MRARGLHEWDQSPYKETWRVPLPVLHQEGRDCSMQTVRGLSSEYDMAGALILNFKPQDPWEANFCCSQASPVFGTLL